jgi:hypothetical protein
LSTNPIFWWSYEEPFPEVRGKKQPSKDFYAPLKVFLFRKVIPWKSGLNAN